MPEKVCDPEPMAKWLEEEIEGECRPCSLAVAVPHYQSVLEYAGLNEHATSLTKALEDEEDPVMSVAKAMDKVKEAVPDEVREALRAVDCMAQNSQQEAKSNVH
jgi:hypothetical protein